MTVNQRFNSKGLLLIIGLSGVCRETERKTRTVHAPFTATSYNRTTNSVNNENFRL